MTIAAATWSACSASTRRPTGRTRSTARAGRTRRPTATPTSSIELLHARGDEPLAVLGPTVRLDFEGDQWTFFKPDPPRPRALFGVDIHEMQPYRPLPDQIAELLGRGRTMTVELDAWFLPDTSATSYRAEHVKTSIIPEAIDPARRAAALLPQRVAVRARGCRLPRHLPARSDSMPTVLPPYTELVSFDAGPRRDGAGPARARRSTRSAITWRSAPASDPFARFGTHLAAELPDLLAGDAAAYHAYAFATVRMAGAGFELLRGPRRLAPRRRRRVRRRGPGAGSSMAPRCSASSSPGSAHSIRTRPMAAMRGPGRGRHGRASGARSAERR